MHSVQRIKQNYDMYFPQIVQAVQWHFWGPVYGLFNNAVGGE
jgi:hypothetical protein